MLFIHLWLDLLFGSFACLVLVRDDKHLTGRRHRYKFSYNKYCLYSFLLFVIRNTNNICYTKSCVI